MDHESDEGASAPLFEFGKNVEAASVPDYSAPGQNEDLIFPESVQVRSYLIITISKLKSDRVGLIWWVVHNKK
jgi:hypothetical protein